MRENMSWRGVISVVEVAGGVQGIAELVYGDEFA